MAKYLDMGPTRFKCTGDPSHCALCAADAETALLQTKALIGRMAIHGDLCTPAKCDCSLSGHLGRATDDQLRAECERRHLIAMVDLVRASDAAAHARLRHNAEDAMKARGLVAWLPTEPVCGICGAPRGHCTPECDDDAVANENVRPHVERGPGIAALPKRDDTIDLATLADLVAADA